ncbi:Brp/Blh family beta-carotene 15,15'-monooxygenase [Halorubrum alkaliphilum]|uniref:Probable beta-carotene 15,15'-dioxygenase n=1 Tax=Halorubrum alkaliphilum TaxID=261290 RepID=A0A8T4GHZ2_9EURY|nr:Brp/Blh family beta-carotene 15,15'-dioxygenase [Halorubrum alkaliphilum]MBP1923896.1 Brp/Blh family beta-carotene 15,15'-monooxygenase [Halorubrum alkaliphilum]
MSTSTVSLARRRIFGEPEHAAIDVSRGALLVLTVGFAALYAVGTEPTLRTQMLVYLVGMVALNLPHGGYEHFSNLRRRGLPFGARYVVLYLGFVAAFIGLFVVAPLLALALAFGTAVAKGGHGDLRVMDALVGSDHLVSRPQRALAAFVRGGAVMIVPAVAWTETFYGFTGYMLNIFDGQLLGPMATDPSGFAAVLGGVYGLAVVAHLGGGLATGGVSTAWLRDLFETSLLVAFFVFVPVVIAIGLYFPLWYSLRQSGRSIAVEKAQPSRTEGVSVVMAWGVLVVGALVTALVAATLWFVAPNPLGGVSLLPGAVAFYTIFVCIIALPHVVVGEWLDFGRGIWHVP